MTKQRMSSIRQALKNLPITKKFLLGFSGILILASIFLSYYFYIFTTTHKIADKESNSIRATALASNLNFHVLHNTVLLSQYNDVRDQPIIPLLKENKKIFMQELEELKKADQNPEVILQLDNFEKIIPEREKLRNKIITAVNQGASLQEIKSLRLQRKVLDNQSIVYLGKIIKIEKNMLDKIIARHDSYYEHLKNSILLMIALIFTINMLIVYWIIHIEFTAYHDYLTGIPNRMLFEKQAAKSLKNAVESNQKMAILLLDLDYFKNVNDTFGHETGDLLLQIVTKRFLSCIKESGKLARIGGDEFAIIVDNVNASNNPEVIAEKLLGILDEPIIIQEYRITITASIGIATYPDAGYTPSLLTRSADAALYKAKKNGKNRYCNFTPELNKELLRHIQIENALRKLLENKKFYLSYQPIFNLNDNSLFGVETLLRWSDPHFADIHNDEAIPIAEDTGLIIPIGNWVIETALRQYQEWRNINPNNTKLAINLSTKQITQKDFYKRIEHLLSTLNINPQNIIFELTETMMIKDIEITINILSLLNKLGCQIYIDDFGAGYASVNLIRKLPISGIKIDKSFIQNTSRDSKNLKLIKMIFSLANSMNLIIISEGIETEEQLNFIKSFAKDQKLQGFYLSRPTSADEIQKLLMAGKRRS